VIGFAVQDFERSTKSLLGTYPHAGQFGCVLVHA
jgi:hypothetical protein